MSPAVAVLSPLRSGQDEGFTAPPPEDRATLDRSLLFIPVLAAAAWALPIGAIWLAWQALR